MKSEYESSADLTIPPDKWVSNDSTISRYGILGTRWGALSGLVLVFSFVFQCRIIQKTQGCGVYGSGDLSAYVFIILFLSIMGGLLGNHIGKEHPAFRGISVGFFLSFFVFQFAWFEILDWLPTQWKGDFLNKDSGSQIFILLAVLYFVGRWHIKRKLKRRTAAERA